MTDQGDGKPIRVDGPTPPRGAYALLYRHDDGSTGTGGGRGIEKGSGTESRNRFLTL